MGEFRMFIEVSEESVRKLIDRIRTVGVPVRRGQREMRGEFASDPGDFGRGIYYSTNYHRAKSYSAEVRKGSFTAKNPLVLSVKDAYQLANRYQTVRLPDEWFNEKLKTAEKGSLHQLSLRQRLENAERMTREILAKGYDCMVVVHPGHLEIVDYRPYSP